MKNYEELFNKYRQLSNEAQGIKDSIDGCLNRIAVTNDEEEVVKMKEFIKKYLEDYIQTARESFNTYTEYLKAMKEHFDKKEVNKNDS